MNGYEYVLESDELFESDESDEFAERQRPGSRQPPRINPGRTGRGTGLFRPRPAGGTGPTGGTANFVTQAQLEAGLARVGTQISANSEAIKNVASQANKINSELGAATARLDKHTAELKKEVKKQAETSLLLTLLQKPPALKTTPQKIEYIDHANTKKEVEVVGKIDYGPQSNLLPLVLLSGSGGLGGGDSSNMLFLALALSGQL